MMAKKPIKKRGRPTKHTEALAREICQCMADGVSLREVCRAERMPAESTVRGWAIDNVEGFSAQYARGVELRAMRWAEEALEIADDGTNDWVKRHTEDDGTKVVCDHEHIQRSRLRVDTRKWLLSKVLPKVYGDKLQHTGDGGGPIRVRPDLSKLTDEELDAIERILGRTANA